MVSAETLLCYLYCTIMFTVNIDASDKQLSDVISQNDKPIIFLNIIWNKLQCKYNTMKK